MTSLLGRFVHVRCHIRYWLRKSPSTAIINYSFSTTSILRDHATHFPEAGTFGRFSTRGMEGLRLDKDQYIRNRRSWTPEEEKMLLELVEELGPRWSKISQFFDQRAPGSLHNHYMQMKDKQLYRGPWDKEELDMLKELVKDPKTTDWFSVQQQLPRRRPINILKLTWKHSLDPKLNHGKWSEDELRSLKELVAIYGPDDNWVAIAASLGTRTPRQCLERWRWQENAGIKGRYTEAEDKAILWAVKKFGDSNFAAIKRAINSPRTPRHISQHYHYSLNPNTDRSPWTDEEREIVYQTCLECNRNMKLAKEKLNSRRNCKDMWNQFYKVDRQKKGEAYRKRKEEKNAAEEKLVEEKVKDPQE
ncbi:Myblike DNAbinding domain-containing protein [Apophysomyces ossiformis]|uniref:Myblike DNAbinding domain-containing protein n=1 Tax=Apophysomyces ossiformis TaxID=679940 RepID=A0A8H7BX19_9FUNG|nr:Myblike DNAbinding domain-containing protein [Apophysomyces ossiformis]